MTDILVDTSVLLDVLTNDPAWSAWSAAAIAGAEGRLCIDQIIVAELAPGFRSLSDLDARLSTKAFHREELPFEAAFQAGRAFAAYRRRGGPRTAEGEGNAGSVPLPRNWLQDHDVAERRPRGPPHGT